MLEAGRIKAVARDYAGFKSDPTEANARVTLT